MAEYFSTHSWEYVEMIIEHLEISLTAVVFAMIIAIPLGIFSTRCRWLERISMAVWGTLRIIPSLAVLVVCIPIMGTGAACGICPDPSGSSSHPA